MWWLLPVAGAPAHGVTPAVEGRTPHGIRTNGQARDNELLNSLRLDMLEELILMLSETKLLQTGSHVCMSQPCCSQGWSGGH